MTCTGKSFNQINMKNMIFGSFIPVFALLVLTASCSPVSYRFALERSKPSSSGLDLSGKSIAAVYAYPSSPEDSLMAAEIAQGFVSVMEEDYFLGADAMPLYNIAYDSSADYADKDTLVGMIVDSGADVVFLFHSFASGSLAVSSANVVELPFTAKLSLYDSMSSEDTVKVYDYSDSFLWSVPGGMEKKDVSTAVSEDLPNAAFKYGGEVASVFAPEWSEESYTIILYENDSEWMNAAELAVFDMDWAAAIRIWMEKADTGDVRKSSSAAYNCALGCYVLGEYGLAEKWLDYSDSLYRFSSSSTLRNRISALEVR